MSLRISYKILIKNHKKFKISNIKKNKYYNIPFQKQKEWRNTFRNKFINLENK